MAACEYNVLPFAFKKPTELCACGSTDKICNTSLTYRYFGVYTDSRFEPYPRRTVMRTPKTLLFRYQRRGVRWVTKKRCTAQKTNCVNGCILNWDVGLGKTVTSFKCAERAHWNALFVCPPNSGRHILSEVAKHYGQQVRAAIFTKWPTNGCEPFPDLTILSFATVASLREEELRLRPHRFHTCIVDEVQDAAGKTRVREVIQDLLHADFFIGLSAMQPLKAAHVLEMLHTFAPVPSKQVFRFSQPPNFTREQRFLTLSHRAKPRYEQVKAQALACTQSLMKHRLLRQSFQILSLDKVPHVVAFLQTIPAHYKIVVVSQFSPTIQALARALPLPFTRRMVIVDTTQKDMLKREACLSAFMTQDACKCLLANLQVVRVTCDLGIADVLVVMEQPYFAKDKLQLEGRLRRCGQRPKNVSVQSVVDIVIKDTADSVHFRTNGGTLPEPPSHTKQSALENDVPSDEESVEENVDHEPPANSLRTTRKNRRLTGRVEPKSKKSRQNQQE